MDVDDENAAPGPFPADPAVGCPIAGLPPDVWFQISRYVACDQSTDFVVTTAKQVDKDRSCPLSGLSELNDIVLRGVPANGLLFITDVDSVSGIGMAELCIRPPNGGPSTVVTDNGPWFAKLHRHHGGAIDRTRTAWTLDNGEPDHRFYVEGTASHKVKLRTSGEERQVVREWHDASELKPKTSQETRSMERRLEDRQTRLLSAETTNFFDVDGATTRPAKGQLTVLALCKAMKIRAKIAILGTLPLMARLDIVNPPDQISQMERPYNLKPQMSYSLHKWLALVPVQWLIANQMVYNSAFRNLCGPPADAVACDGEVTDVQLPTREEANDHLYPARTAAGGKCTNKFLRRKVTHPYHNSGFPIGTAYASTSFEEVSALMVYAFFACANRFVSLTSDAQSLALVQRAHRDQAFRQEFAVKGPHVTPAAPCKRLCVSKANAAAPANSSPEMDLLGGFAGVF